MEIEVILKNYRAFSDDHPVRLVIRQGFTGFVGVNNSGKSSLLKFMYEFRGIFQTISPSNWSTLLPALGAGQGAGFMGVKDPLEVFHDHNDRDLEVEVRVIDPDNLGRTLPPVTRALIRIQRLAMRWTLQLYTGNSRLDLKNPSIQGNDLHDNGTPVAALDGLWTAAQIITRVLYIGPFRNAINVQAESDYFDIQVGQAFIRAWRILKTGAVKKQNETAYRLTEAIRRIFGFQSLEINATSDDKTLQIFVNGRSYKLDELGSGIAQFILVLANAAVKEPSLILIDEPELNLHPSLQLDFLTTLGSYAATGVVFATHSIGLARSASDWIYSVRRSPSGAAEVRDLESTPRLSEFLGELGFSSYRELGFDKVLMVEGTTDLKTIQQFLRLMGQEHRVLLLPLGGSQMINENAETSLLEVSRISEHVCAIIDSERSAAEAPLDPSRIAFVETCAKLGIQCHVLERRAVENYFSERSIKRVKGPKYRALGPHELLRAADPAWSKAENWRIAREMNLDELGGTDLGKFLLTL